MAGLIGRTPPNPCEGRRGSTQANAICSCSQPPMRRDGKTLKYADRKPTARAKADEVRALAAEKRGLSYIAEKLGISRVSVHRILKARP
jgi:hypothetical protein